VVSVNVGESPCGGVLVVISKGVGDYHEDRSALVALLQAVLPEMQAGLAVKESAMEA
jgi:hypothetical protein